MLVYSRELVVSPADKKPLESVKYVCKMPLQIPARALAWYAMEGGIYYLTGDNELHWLEGAEGN